MKTKILSKPILKASSIIFGYLFWLILAQSQSVKINIDLPLFFYGIDKNLKLNPETDIVKGLISGKRIDIYNHQLADKSAHIDLSSFNQPGTYSVALVKENIFLHNKLKLINYWPSNLSVQLEEKSK